MAAKEKEAIVRGKAVESLGKVATQINAHDLEVHVTPTLQRLAVTKSYVWYYGFSQVVLTKNFRLCLLFSVCYPRVSTSIKADLRNLFRQLCQDYSPMVWRTAAGKLGELAKVVEVEYLRFKIDVCSTRTRRRESSLRRGWEDCRPAKSQTETTQTDLIRALQYLLNDDNSMLPESVTTKFDVQNFWANLEKANQEKIIMQVKRNQKGFNPIWEP